MLGFIILLAVCAPGLNARHRERRGGGARSARLAAVARARGQWHLARNRSDRQWDPAAEGSSGNVLWTNTELGGISTPIVMRGKLYTIVRSDAGTSKDCQKVVCADAATGKKIWEARSNVFLTDVPAERIGWASCAGDPATAASTRSAPAETCTAWTARPASCCGTDR